MGGRDVRRALPRSQLSLMVILDESFDYFHRHHCALLHHGLQEITVPRFKEPYILEQVKKARRTMN